MIAASGAPRRADEEGGGENRDALEQGTDRRSAAEERKRASATAADQGALAPIIGPELPADAPRIYLVRETTAPIGDVATGRVRRPDGITVLHEANGGFGDMAMASTIYERALELGRGTERDMG